MAGYVDDGLLMCDVVKWNKEPAVAYNRDSADGAVPTLDVRDLPASVRLQIDDIIRHHGDLESQIDALDALLYGKKCQAFVDDARSSSNFD